MEVNTELAHGMVTLHSGFSDEVQAQALFYLLAFYLCSLFSWLREGVLILFFIFLVFCKTTGLQCRSGRKGWKGCVRKRSPLLLVGHGVESPLCRAQIQQLDKGTRQWSGWLLRPLKKIRSHFRIWVRETIFLQSPLNNFPTCFPSYHYSNNVILKWELPLIFLPVLNSTESEM